MSELEISDAGHESLTTDYNAADVKVLLGHVPDFSSEEKYERLTDACSFAVPDPQMFYMHCDGFDFKITDGDTIIIDTHGQDVEGSGLVAFVLGSAFGVVGIQRGFIPIHGAAVETGDTAAIITGRPGSGKSAILGELVRAGRRYLADDVCMVSIIEGRPFVFPSYPQRKIAADSAAEAGEDASGAILINEDDKKKYAIRNASEWLNERRPLSSIIEIFPAKKKDNSAVVPETIEIKGHASLRLVLRNQFRLKFADGIGTPPQRMKQLLEITSSIKTYQIIRPVEGFPVSDTAQMISEMCL